MDSRENEHRCAKSSCVVVIRKFPFLDAQSQSTLKKMIVIGGKKTVVREVVNGSSGVFNPPLVAHHLYILRIYINQQHFLLS